MHGLYCVALGLRSQAGRLACSKHDQEATELALRASVRVLRMWLFYGAILLSRKASTLSIDHVGDR